MIPSWQTYARKNQAELAPWLPDFDMEGVSVGEVDKRNGSPKEGDMIARNPLNHDDKWLVSAEYFAENFVVDEPVTAETEMAINDPILRLQCLQASEGKNHAERLENAKGLYEWVSGTLSG